MSVYKKNVVVIQENYHSIAYRHYGKTTKFCQHCQFPNEKLSFFSNTVTYDVTG